jgi:hypothetical protein
MDRDGKDMRHSHKKTSTYNGTTFTVYLPASQKEIIKEKVNTLPIARGKETIMLVDDEKMVLEGNKEVLEFLGYKVYTCGNGRRQLPSIWGKAMKLIWFNYRRKNGQV